MPIALSLAAVSLKTKGKIKFSLMNKIQAKAFLISLCLFFLVMAMGIFYLVQANVLATRGYKISSLEAQVKALQEQNKLLELKASEIQSIKKISERVETLGMTQVAYTEYLSPTSDSVAVR